jgi:hypothetical protein
MLTLISIWVKVYVPDAVLRLGFQVPVIPLLDVVCNIGAECFFSQIGEIALKKLV